jgi:4-hydroxy-tetrahydrodipicolinate synthase
MRLQFTGLGTALITPFTRGGALDEAAVTRLAKRQAEAAVHFVVPCGTTGEAPTLTEAEKLRVIELVADAVDGRAMVLAGAGGYDTREVIHAIKQCERAGAHGILSVSPYYNKPTQEGLYQHYKALAGSTTLPIIIYNVPGRTGSNVEPATVARLAAVPNIVGVKEASGNMSQIADVCRRVPSDFIVLSGDDALALPVMSIGGKGVISVVSNVAPARMAEMWDAAAAGNWSRAREIHYQLRVLNNLLFAEPSPAPTKACLHMMGRMGPDLRAPIYPVSAALAEQLRAELVVQGIL